MKLPPLKLRKDQERRLLAGHLWIYSNEVDSAATPLKDFEPGSAVAILSQRGKWLGNGYVNPHSLICARILSTQPRQPLDERLIEQRLANALAWRERLFARPCYRLAFGESDLLPGLVVDRYGEHLVAQITTAGMERLKPAIIQALHKVVAPRGVLWRNDSPVRAQEGLPLEVSVAAGDMPEKLQLEEGPCRFEIAPFSGQKTGWFYDQAANRDRMCALVDGRRVLDICSYVGGWGVRAAAAGASSVLCVDTSQAALEQTSANAEMNGVGDRVSTHRGDAFEVLRELREAGERFDVVLLDPPAFIKRKKDLSEGTLAYRRLNQAALQVTANDGVLVTSSCSYHMSRELLTQTLQHAAGRAGVFARILEFGQQGPDHPVHPAIAETAYLKSLFVSASRQDEATAQD